MRVCSKCGSESPDTTEICENCQSDLSEWSTTAVALQRLKTNPRVEYIRIMVYDDCCPACRAIKGAYPKDQVLELPIQGCSHKLGCRCFYQPFLNDIYP